MMINPKKINCLSIFKKCLKNVDFSKTFQDINIYPCIQRFLKNCMRKIINEIEVKISKSGGNKQ